MKKIEKMKRTIFTAAIAALILFGGFTLNAQNGQNVQPIGICPGQTVTLTASPENTIEPPVYEWYLNGSLVNEVTGAVYSLQPSDKDTIYCKIITFDECAVPDYAYSDKYAINYYPVPVLTQLSNLQFCDGELSPEIKFDDGSDLDWTKVKWAVVDGDWAGIGMENENGVGVFPAFTVSTTDSLTVTIEVTPVSANKCEGTPITFTISVKPLIEVTFGFDNTLSFCQHSKAMTLPTTSELGIKGTWSPEFIDTSTLGVDVEYTFTPDTYECGLNGGVFILYVTIIENVTPDFGFGETLTYCQGADPEVLLETSLNGINGTWNFPAIDTNTPGNVTYTFTPDPGQCVISDGVVNVDVTVNATLVPSVTIDIVVE